MNISKLAIITILFTVTFSCDSEKSMRTDLTSVLELSGTNRPELEKVLHHYSQNQKDSLKLKAAEFLIRNMPHHRSMCGECVENHIQTADTLYHKISLPIRSVYYMIPARLDSLKDYVETEADIEKITADFLIKNIEYSFDAWENSIYEPKVSFDDFCEYILPYKHSQEPLVLWKDSSDSKNSSRDLDTYVLNMTTANTHYNYTGLSQHYMPYSRLFGDNEIYSVSDNLKYRIYMELAFMRSKGIPTAADFIPFTDISRNNYWTTTINKKYIDNSFAYINTDFSSKVFRRTYSQNPIPNDKNNFIPDFIRDPHNKDVTEIYQNVATVEYDFGDVPSTVKYAYLATFYNGKWCEVSWSELKNGIATFKNMGRDIIYMPLYYDEDVKICASRAIHLDRDGNLSEIGVIDDEKQSITLERVSAYDVSGEYQVNSIIDGKIAACDIPENLKFDTLATITHAKYNKFDTVNVSSDKKYKCWLFITNRYPYFSELQFFDKDGEQVQGQVVWIGRDNKISYKPSVFAKFFDNNIMTSTATNSIVGLLLEKPTAISYVKYMPANDGCGIMPGNEYELFYLYNGKWISFEKKVATDYAIEFSNIPANALFWLHDRGKQCDERPFTIVNGKIKFW